MSTETKKSAVTKESRMLALVQDQSGRIGYLIAWFCGVPASVLLVIFLLRGH